jgi:hypothetical protein
MKLSRRLALLPAVLGAASATAQIVINELHVAPEVKQERVEFVELHNAGTNAVDLGGWAFTAGVAYTFPAGTTLAPGAYRVVAQDPAALAAKYGVAGALGPWTGRLSNEGERVTLVDARGAVRDEVRYGLGFPWPTTGDAPGNSLELLNPALDNDLGGSWRSSQVGGAASEREFVPAGGSWRYLKGTAAPSTPAGAWREPGFNEQGWAEGELPIGYDPEILGPAITGGTRLSHSL